MTDPIRTGLELRAIRLKLAKDSEGDEYRVAEIVFMTQNLRAATELAWYLGTEITAEIAPTQPRLPDETPMEQALNGTASKSRQPTRV